MDYETANIEALNRALIEVIEGRGDALNMIQAAQHVLPFTAAFCVVNKKGQQPDYLGDTYPDGPAKDAVQLYVSNTYLLNPIYNAFLNGLEPGLHRMSDLGPDNWNSDHDASDVLLEDGEEIGFRTPGWPTGLQELALTVDLPGGAMGEISFARPSSQGGFTPLLIDRLRPFHPVFAAAFRQVWSGQRNISRDASQAHGRLEDFGGDALSPREAEVMHMILKGHSSLSINMSLGIALPTVKTHRKNAYVKLGISTQQQLFSAFLTWQDSLRK